MTDKWIGWSGIIVSLLLISGCQSENWFPLVNSSDVVLEEPDREEKIRPITNTVNQTVTAQVIKPSFQPYRPGEIKQFPQDVGWIDIKKDYGAKGDGITDDTPAIIQALNIEPADYTRPKIIYFPEGTYLVSNTLQRSYIRQDCCITFQGQGRGKTVIKLQDNTDGFNNQSNPKAVIKTKQGNVAFRHYIRDLTIDTGKGNPGAIGIDYVSSNRGGIIDVAIRSGDGQGKVGLAMIREWPGPSLIKNLLVQGFDYGIQVRHREYGLVLENITLKQQRIAGIDNHTNSLAIRKLESSNSVPAIVNQKGGLVIVIDGEFTGGKSTVSAIDNDAHLYARNIVAEGYGSAIKQNNNLIYGLTQEEYISHQPNSLFNSPSSSLSLPIEDTPFFHDNNLDNWANVKDYRSIQTAMDSGESTIYFPKGNYVLNKTINIPATVNKIIGFESYINLQQKDVQGALRVTENSPHPLIIEGLLLEKVALEHLSGRTLVLKHSKLQDRGFRNSPQAGKLFLEDVQMHLNLDYPQNVWARQLNAESLFETQTKVLNKGGNLWILGLKTEGKGTAIKTTDGGRTELLGTLIYPVRLFEEKERDQAAFVNNESSHSLIYSVSASSTNRNYPIQVTEIRDGQTKSFSSAEMVDRVMSLFVGY